MHLSMPALPNPFEPDPGLRSRMLAAVAVHVALLAAIVALLVWLVLARHIPIAGAIVVIALLGLAAGAGPRVDAAAVDLAPGLQERLEEVVNRLCVLADMPAPACVVQPEILALSYTVARFRQRPRLVVTVGMMLMLEGRELDAVVAHELSHIANRDAVMMTMLAGPGTALKAGAHRFWKPTSMRVTELLLAMAVGAVILPVAAVLNMASRSVSRRRELHADHGAALLTGSPAAVATVLERVSQSLRFADLPDLRAVSARDAFHILPTGPEPDGWGRLSATHPPLQTRLEHLHEMEHRLQPARLRADAGE